VIYRKASLPLSLGRLKETVTEQRPTDAAEFLRFRGDKLKMENVVALPQPEIFLTCKHKE
jgi:hypothetical protein